MILINKYIFFLLALLTSVLCGQNKYYDYRQTTQPFSKYFSPKEYNSGASNWSIAQDNRGVMYFGNMQGLLEYDGNSWRKINIPFSSLVRTITIDDNGKIFITASSDFGYLEPDSIGQLEFISLKSKLDKVRKIDKQFWDVAVNSKGVFYKTPDEVIRWDGKDFKIWDSVYAFRLYKIDDEIYSRNQNKGLMKIEEDTIFVIPDGQFFEDTGVYDMLPFSVSNQGKTESIVITTNYDGLFIYDGKKNVPFKTEIDEWLYKNQVYNACILNNGDIALTTQRGGVAIIDKKGNLNRFLNQDSGLPTNVAYDVYPDKQGGLWIATNEGIVFSEVNSPLSLIPAEGQLRSQINSIIKYENNLYIANDIGVLMLDNSKSNFELLEGSNKPAYQFLKFKDHLFASTNWGLKIIKGKKFSDELDPGSITFSSPSSIFPDVFYFGSTKKIGMVKLEPGKPPVVKTINVGSDENDKIVEDDDSTLWVTQPDKPLYHIITKIKGFETDFNSDSIRIDNYADIEGLPGKHWAIFNFEGRFLLSTDQGTYRFDKNSKSFIPDSTFETALPPSDFFIQIIEKSSTGDYWILAEGGGYSRIGKAVKQKNGKFKWEPIPIINRIDIQNISNIYADYNPIINKEVLWISTSEGLVYYDPEVKKDINIPFSVLIRRALVKNDSLVYAGNNISGNHPDVIIPYSQNNIRFEFSAISYEKSEKNQYQYYLEGSNDGWSTWTTENKKDYTNLSGGSYVFKVRAKNIYGIVSSESSFSFRVLPPWYLSWWAYILYAILLFIGVFVTDRIMRRRVINKERNQAKLNEAELIKKQASELETVDRLVKVINRAENLDQLFNSLLEQTFTVIPQGEKAAVFLLDKKYNLFRVAFTEGYKVRELEKVVFTPEELKKRYTQSSEEVEKGIYIIQDTGQLYADEKLSGFGNAESMLVMAVEIDNVTEAYVVFDNFSDKNAFDQSTARLLNRFREHAVSAISKAQAIKTLQEKNIEIMKAQTQLVHSEKMASLGELTAGIAHEIKNPLNFVNNFSDLSKELIEEVQTELQNNNKEEVISILEDLKQNLDKINQHGKRADSIVRGMLQHSRGSSGEKVLTDINELLEQYVNLAYHGMRAQNKDFNITIEKEYDTTLEKLNVVPQDLSRVFLNIINNGCYAAYERGKKATDNDFSPTLKVSTKNLNGKVEIRIGDNGNGIPANILDKIFQPFFTTKPTGEGTGLGLSLSYDIITKVHNGELKVETNEGVGTEFIIILNN